MENIGSVIKPDEANPGSPKGKLENSPRCWPNLSPATLNLARLLPQIQKDTSVNNGQSHKSPSVSCASVAIGSVVVESV